MMNSQRILTFLNANPSILYWHISEFEAIENGVQANANNNHRLKVIFKIGESFQITLTHKGKFRTKMVKCIKKVTPFDLHDVITNVLALIRQPNAA